MIAAQINQIPPELGRAQLWACCDVLAGLRFEKELIKRIFREEVMQESVTYQDILQKGVERGLKQGIQQGMQLGLQLRRNYGCNPATTAAVGGLISSGGRSD
ncbi:hypothetical protein [Synechococcus sp. PCC 6312]|uniref:hypothetical protein n=1 Tax=Synechococcus sp. (strain ATCC 27167 / PCC 6312) TaxID=195253 RepID=UPI0002FF36EC|nr:hypothetical protein [Synechococcus sp. PCC 6312]